jgi:glycosyltransferase involved in cell wall biosynthesis
MKTESSLNRYVVISPAKDEEKYVEATLRSVVNQTYKPFKWVIVDDGSSDRTPEILATYAKQVPWIQVVRIERDARRLPGSAIIHAFNRGFEDLRGDSFDFIVKLDCDLELPADYFERLLNKFQEDVKLGLVSGVYLENHNGIWTQIPMPAYHAAGASKMMRRKCFEEIGGFVARRGWDTVDEIKAQTRGWKTVHFKEIQFRHLKLEGSGIGDLRTNFMHGEIYYLTGGSKLFFLLKVLHRMGAGRPLLIGGVAMLWGWLCSWVTRRERLVSREEAVFYGGQLNARIWNALGRIFRRHRTKKEAWSVS